MPTTLTKLFPFSASYERGGKIFAHNFILGVTVEIVSGTAEEDWAELIQGSVIKKVLSRDLGLDVDFLKGAEITDLKLLDFFWDEIHKAIRPRKLVGLSLETDSRSRYSKTAS